MPVYLREFYYNELTKMLESQAKAIKEASEPEKPGTTKRR
jgi:hypothetical protein